MTTIAEARVQWALDGVYLNAASYGLPPRDGFETLQAALPTGAAGARLGALGRVDGGRRARRAQMVGVPATLRRDRRDAVEPRRSRRGLDSRRLARGRARGGVHLDAVFSRQQQQRGVRVTTAPAARLAEAIDAGTDIVAFSAVQMSSGDVADVEAVVAAAEHRGARTVLDATQACGWMPIDATRFGAVVRAGYNWLTLARGTAFDDRL